jgi:hypothetical protein
MADDDAVRSRRYRAHKAGQHILCDPRRCEGARRLAETGEVARPAPGQATVRATLDQFLAELAPPPGSSRAVLAQCATKLADAIDAGGGPAVLTAQMRHVLSDLEDVVGRDENALDEIRARHHLRRLNLLLPVPG